MTTDTLHGSMRDVGYDDDDCIGMGYGLTETCGVAIGYLHAHLVRCATAVLTLQAGEPADDENAMGSGTRARGRCCAGHASKITEALPTARGKWTSLRCIAGLEPLVSRQNATACISHLTCVRYSGIPLTHSTCHTISNQFGGDET
jgi:hypothetical protein